MLIHIQIDPFYLAIMLICNRGGEHSLFIIFRGMTEQNAGMVGSVILGYIISPHFNRGVRKPMCSEESVFAQRFGSTVRQRLRPPTYPSTCFCYS